MTTTLPRIRIAHLPTRIEALPRVSAMLGGVNVWIKRDDQTGLALGGNKTRKLEYLIAAAQANGAKTLITAGAKQSNHCRQTAAAAARFGFDCILVLTTSDPTTKMSTTARVAQDGSKNQTGVNHIATGNLLLDNLFGARIVWTTTEEREHTLQQVFQQAWDDGFKPYLIPYGGSSPTGAAAYVFAIKELMEQLASSATEMGNTIPDYIVFASSSGGTQSGMIVGARLFDYPGKVLGISVDESEQVLRERVAVLATETASFLQESHKFNSDDVFVNANYLGGGYGVMGKIEYDAIHLFAQKEGLLLDPVYTGRAAGALLALCADGFFRPGENILFWHTGGTPALFAEQYQANLL